MPSQRAARQPVDPAGSVASAPGSHLRPVGPAQAYRSALPDRTVEICSGPALEQALAEAADLAYDVGAPLSARGDWARPVIRDLPDDVWAVLVRQHSGRLCAFVLLVDGFDPDGDPGARELRLVGTDGGQRGAILAVDLRTAHLAGCAVRAELLSRRSLPSLALGPLPAGDPRVEAFARGLTAMVVATDAIPMVDTTMVGDLTDVLTHGTARTLRKARNRLTKDHRTWRVETRRDPADVVPLLPLVAELYRERDHRSGRRSDLDDRVAESRWAARIGLLAASGLLELTTLHIDGDLAAYVLGVRDGEVYRLLEGRFVTAWARYSPGRLLEAEVLDRVIRDRTLRQMDWVTAVAPETLLAQNCSDQMVRLTWGEPALSRTA